MHLALEYPDNSTTLAELGYQESSVDIAVTNVAATSCFRVLSDEGVEALYHICK